MDQQKIYRADFDILQPTKVDDRDWNFSLYIKSSLSPLELRKMLRTPEQSQFCIFFGQVDPENPRARFPKVYGIEDWWGVESFMLNWIYLHKLTQINEEDAKGQKVFEFTKEGWQKAYKKAWNNHLVFMNPRLPLDKVIDYPEVEDDLTD